MAVREWYMQLALQSYRKLVGVIGELTEEEVLAALSLEKSSRRRKSIIDALTRKAAEFNRQTYLTSLKEK
ncbi:hypothetical protein [Uliginosibacterium gangwonense]|uniref:hypothetical protein n=1 Tax=Uliginosibacterium gangwonense TaxID=392736 RepID=UPI0003760D72|nr:hypothetical protein [Uliginosibacterium gangwonense]